MFYKDTWNIIYVCCIWLIIAQWKLKVENDGFTIVEHCWWDLLCFTFIFTIIIIFFFYIINCAGSKREEKHSERLRHSSLNLTVGGAPILKKNVWRYSE